MKNENKKYTLNEHIRNISHIADKEYQIRVWIQGKGPEVNDFDETVCHFFDDGDPILKNYKEYGITDNQYLLLKEFRDQFQNFSDEHNWPEEFLDTPEWSRIMDMAREVLKEFNFSKISDK